ncbi:hypothetical protein DFQ28_005746 [Apophysomyces sp. BC1034]|nr:hypothetical protein DFQ30_003801 [Apophysomyces sp. BC1015]KAG0182603.1 hypothetical protein DFQ29_003156 [Apophysomyces sp. BC1021]KAG0193303.1 hypothetical protein DFQ28_005746 [Apophysomyces sp. BC1034]
MKIQSSLLAVCVFLFAVVSATSYPATIQFDKTPASKNPTTYHGVMNVKGLKKPVQLVVTGDIDFKEESSKGMVEVIDIKELQPVYDLVLNDGMKKLKIGFKLGNATVSRYEGSSVAIKKVSGLKGTAQIQ